MVSGAQLKSVDHIGIVVKDLEAAKAFCSAQLGLGQWETWEFPGVVKGTTSIDNYRSNLALVRC